MNEQDIISLAVRAFVDGHFILTSWRHSRVYINKDALSLYPWRLDELAMNLARLLLENTGGWCDVVAAPALGGIVLGNRVAFHYGHFQEWSDIISVYAEKDGEEFIFKRGFGAYLRDGRVAVVEDVLTTGKSARGVVKAVQKCGGEVVAVGALFNRGKVTAKDVGGVPLVSLINQDLKSWEAKHCPLCKAGVPISQELGRGG